MHGIPVEPDQLAQELERQQVLRTLVLFVEDDLGQDAAGQVLVGLGVIDDEIDAFAHHVGQVIERDVRTGSGVVQTPVRVLLDHHRFVAGWAAPASGGLVGLRHVLTLCPGGCDCAVHSIA